MAKPASGMYKTKARNLTDAQLKRAKGMKASGKRTVDIGVTKRITEGALKGKTVGAGGKPLTGTVIMENGDRAVYKAGKRVTNVPKKSAAPVRRNVGGGGGGGGGKPVKTTTTRVTPQARGEGSARPSRGVQSGTVTSAIAAGKKMGASGASYKPKPKTPVQRAMSSNSGYVRGVKGSQASIDAMKGKGTLKGNLAKKRAEDTKNDTRNALVIAGLAAAPFAGAKLAGGSMAARGAAAIAARGAGKTAAKTVTKRPRPATKTPAWTKYGKDIKITRNARDRAQQARLDKFLAAKKTTAKKATPAKRTPAKRTPKKK